MRLEVLNTRQAIAEDELGVLIGRLAEEAGVAVEPFELPRGAKDNRLKALFRTEYLVYVLHQILGDAPQEDAPAEPTENGEVIPTGVPIEKMRLPPVVTKNLIEAGYTTYESLEQATDHDILMVRGVGSLTVERIRQELTDAAT